MFGRCFDRTQQRKNFCQLYISTNFLPPPVISSVLLSTEVWHMAFAKITKWSEIWLPTSLAYMIKWCETDGRNNFIFFGFYFQFTFLGSLWQDYRWGELSWPKGTQSKTIFSGFFAKTFSEGFWTFFPTGNYSGIGTMCIEFENVMKSATEKKWCETDF